MTDLGRGWIATPQMRPLFFVEWIHNCHWFVYIAGFRTGALMAGEETAFYRSVTGEGKMFASLHDAITELERLANWIVVANAEFCRRGDLYA